MKFHHLSSTTRPGIILFLALIIFHTDFTCSQIPYPGTVPQKPAIRSAGKDFIIENNVLRMTIAASGGKMIISRFEDKITKESFNIGAPLFELRLQDGKIMGSDDFMLKAIPVISDLTGNPQATSFAERQPGKKLSADLEGNGMKISLHWEAELRNGSNYVRHIYNFRNTENTKISGMSLIIIPAEAGFRKNGTVDGCPLVRNTMFAALEYPLSRIEENTKNIISYFPGMQNTLSTVWGVTPQSQLRRGFLYYVERERIHPYHQVLHYNSWYDISYSGKQLNEAECLDRIKVFGDSLITQRKVPMDAFLIDDGWDDHTTLWEFHSGFPEGFANLKKACVSYESGLGVWLSPFGGYGKEKELRLEYGRKQNPPFETNKRGFALAGPVYYNRFREVTGSFIKNYDVYMFKFDGVGAGSGGDVVYQKDVEAFLRLLQDLLKMKPDLYLDLTTGTWPSVYWLKFGDNIWRGGDDTNVLGEGSNRQKWITYRDADVYKNVVSRGPLFPLNALMTCGICIADLGLPSKFEMNDRDIADEIWSFFATGVNLQELYMNPHKLNTANWNCLAAAASWARTNEKVMTDIHWVGGDPGKGEVYGYAAWMAGKAVLSLRNPTSGKKTFNVNVAQALDLPENENASYVFRDALNNTKVAAGKDFTVTLKPFEVKIMDAVNQESVSRK